MIKAAGARTGTAHKWHSGGQCASTLKLQPLLSVALSCVLGLACRTVIEGCEATEDRTARNDKEA